MFESDTKCGAEAPDEHAGRVAVFVTTNGVDFSDSSIVFHGLSGANITEINPMMGPELGGTAVTLTGENLDMGEVVLCDFGGSCRTEGMWISPTAMVCVSPPRSPASVYMKISLNGQQFGDVPAAAFRFSLRPMVLRVNRTSSPIWRRSGRGSLHQPRGVCNSQVSLREVVVAATFVNSSAAMSSAAPGWVGKVGANNGVDFTTGGIEFTWALPCEWTVCRPKWVQ